MALSCPRCNRPMQEMQMAARDGSGPLVVDTCARCGGLWLDGDEVAAAYPALEGLSRHEDQLRAGAGPQTSAIGGCPRCGARSIEFPFYEVRLDYCPGCDGVWIDGLELVPLGRRLEGRGADALDEGLGNYRTSAMHALEAGVFRCKRCSTRFELAEAVLTSDGPMCEACGPAFEREDRGGLDLADVAALRRAGVNPAAVAPTLGARILAVVRWVLFGAMPRE